MIGSRISHFEITAKLGEGGMGEVYRADDTRLGRQVAIKLLPSEFTDDPERLARFEHEARVLASMNHPGIVAIYSLERSAAASFLVMELVDGQTLEKEITGAEVAFDRFFDIAIPLAETLAAAHGHGIVHRDLKPANIMLTSSGRVKVLDFGLAKQQTATGDVSGESETQILDRLTGQHQIVGTAPYMSPEQIRSEPLDERSDIFSLGVILYELLTGSRPFHGSTIVDLISSILKEETTGPASIRPAVSEALDVLVLGCLAKDRADRIASALEVRDRLIEIRQGTVEPEPPKAPVGLDVRTVGVLPFAVLGAAEDADFLASGLHNDLITELSRVPGLTVISRSSALRYEGTDKTGPEIGRELNAGTLISGTMQCAGARVRVTAQLIDAAEDAHRWAERYDRELSTETLFDLQSELATKIVGSLRPKLAPSIELPTNRPQTESLEAYRLCNLGRMQLDRRTETACRRAAEHFEKAVELDPEYVLAWVGLADSLGLITSYAYEKSETMIARAKEAALRAIELDPSSAEAHASLAMFYASTQDSRSFQNEIKLAIELNPGYSESHNWNSYYQQLIGDAGCGLESARRAVELNPLSAEAVSNLALAYLTTGDAEGALAEATRCEELSPGWTTAFFYQALALLHLGRFDEAISALTGLTVEWAGKGAEATLALTHAAAGDEDSARAVLTEIGDDEDPFAAGLIRLAIGEVDSGFELLARVERFTDWPSLAIHHLYREVWDGVSTDPRFRELVRRAFTSWNLEPPEEALNG